MPEKPPDAETYNQIIRGFRTAAAATVALLSIGVVFYHVVEKFSWIDSLYFCVITLTTIGYGDLVPKTDLGKLFTVFYVLAGIGVIATFANLAVKRALLRHMTHKQKRQK